MKILGAIRDDAADAYYRVVAPFSVLQYSATGHEWKIRRPSLGDADEFDAVLLQRYCDSLAEIVAREFRERGKPVVYDADDWLEAIPPSWSAFDHYRNRGQDTPRPQLIFHQRVMGLADLVTCPTEALAGKLRERGLRVAVLPNAVLQGDWDTVLPAGCALEGPVVGWFGWHYHWDDWRQIAHAVDRALEEVGGHLAVLGFPEVVRCFPPRLAARTWVQPAVNWNRFPDFRRLITAFDVGLAWLEDTEFNRCKSPLKAFQYGAAGVPVVASRTVYGGVMEHGVHGLLADDPDKLAEAIVQICLDKEEAQTMARAWQSEVWAKHSYERTARRWLDVFEELFEEKRDGDGKKDTR